MTTFTLATSIHTETATGEGLVILDFPSGSVTPSNDQELTALTRLVEIGLATIADDPTPKKSAPKVAEVPQADPSASAPAADATSKE